MRRLTLVTDPAPRDPEFDRLLAGAHHDPHSVLGAHPRDGVTTVRALRPSALAVTALHGGARYPLREVADGLFVGSILGTACDYRLETCYPDGPVTGDDPYRWLPTVDSADLHAFTAGAHRRLWELLGAQIRQYDTPAGRVRGTAFTVWAPTAQGVRVAGDFNCWDDRGHPMRSLGSSGVWELFVPGVEEGVKYKFRLLGRDGDWHEHADPVAFAAEPAPATASVVTTSQYQWGDQDWMHRRARTDWNRAPMSIYEVHLGSWRRGSGGYRELARELADYVTELGFTHVELMPLAEHPFGGSWGYQVTSYYAPTARYGNPDDLRYLVDQLHQAGIGVILDWVPAHFPRDEWALGRFDGTALYEHPDPRRGEHPDWGTYIFDYGRPEVRNFLVASALYWIEEFHLDGLRVDAVASMLYLDYSRPDGAWLPNVNGGRENLDAVAFLRELTGEVRRRHPGALVVAEESTAWPGVTADDGLGFHWKWNMGWMHDTLQYLGRDPVHRSYHHGEITFSAVYAWSERFILPLSHDEVVHGKGSLWQKMPGDDYRKAAGLRCLFGYMWAHPGKQLLFMGGEFGQPREWSADESLPWELVAEQDGAGLHRGIQRLVQRLNEVYRELPALYTQDVEQCGFEWIDHQDANGNVLAFLRLGSAGSMLACVVNFAGTAHQGYRVGLPHAGPWREVLNTEDEAFGGAGTGRGTDLMATSDPYHGRPASVVLDLPPSSVLWLVPAE